MLIYPTINPVAIQLGPLAVHWYGLMYLAGFLSAWWLLKRRAKAQGVLDAKQVEDLIFYAVLGVILGGRLGFMLFYDQGAWLSNPMRLIKVWEGGMSFHGGLIGVIVAMWGFARKHEKTFFQITDFIAPAVAPGLFFGRIGNFINGELWGKPTDFALGFLHNGVVKHASQLYEALLEGLVLFVVLWWFSSKMRPTRAVSGLFLIGYGSFRFLVEFVRVPDRELGYLAWDWLTMGQVLSVPMVFLGVWLMGSAYAKTAKKGVATEG